MGKSSVLFLSFFAALPVAFVALNYTGDQTQPRWPTVVFTSTRRIGVDVGALGRSIHRMVSVTYARQLGNSLRIAAGQRVSWVIRSSRTSPMLFHRVELWASEGLTPANRKTVERVVASASHLNALLRVEGWELFVLPVPTKISIYADRCQWPLVDGDPLTKHPVNEDRADEVYDALAAGLRSAHIEVVDLRTAYREYRGQHPEQLLYPPGETHWSGTGLQVAADTTARQIATETKITPRHFAPMYLPVVETADLAAAFDPLPAWTSWLRHIYTYHDELEAGAVGSGYAYAPNPTSLLYVAGTSYSGQFTWHLGQPVGFAWVLGARLEAVEFMNGAIAGHGSSAAMRSFLGQRAKIVDSFIARHGRRPEHRIVVWEFPLRDLGSVDIMP